MLINKPSEKQTEETPLLLRHHNNKIQQLNKDKIQNIPLGNYREYVV